MAGDGATADEVRAIALGLPGATEGTSYGTPAFRVAGSLFLRLHQDGRDLVARAEGDARDVLVASDADVFHVTDHYRGHPWVLVRLAAVSRDQLEHVIEHAWRDRAPARLLAERDH